MFFLWHTRSILYWESSPPSAAYAAVLCISAPSHYMNQCRLIFIGTLRNKLQSNPNQNTKHCIHENFKMSSAKWRNECRMSAQCWKSVKTSVCVICCPGGTYAYMNVFFFLPPELQSLTRALSVNPKHGYWWFHWFRWKLNMIRLCSCELKEKNQWGDKLRPPGKTLSNLSKIYLQHY